jgi:acyl carrier protein
VADAKASAGTGPAAATGAGAAATATATTTATATKGTATGETVLAVIRRTINVELGIAQEVQPEDDLIADLHLDSVGLLTLVVELENTFRIALGVEDSASVRTVRDLVSVVLSRTRGGP